VRRNLEPSEAGTGVSSHSGIALGCGLMRTLRLWVHRRRKPVYCFILCVNMSSDYSIIDFLCLYNASYV